MWLLGSCGDQQVDHGTLWNFRRRHHGALAQLCVPAIRLGHDMARLKLRHVAVDGTKLKAYASKHGPMIYGR